MKMFFTNIIKFIAMLICKHNMESVDNSSYYSHSRCTKCGIEKGLGNFRIKN